jgi:hypothetical protein
MAVVAGLITAGVVGAAGAAASAYGASASADAQQQAAQTAANSQNQANKLNYQMYEEAHGSTGHAVLPIYMGNFEQNLGTDLTNAYQQSSVPLTTFQAATGKLAPAEQGAIDTTNGIFNGGITRTMLANNAPVQAQRLVQANNQVNLARSSSLDALHKTLNSIDAQQAARGYVGDSYANRLLQFQAGKTGGDAVASAMSNVDAAQLQNTQDVANIKNYGNVTLPLQNLNTPYTQAQQSGQFAFLPQDEWLQSISQRMQPLNMLKIGYTGPFQYQPLPTPGPGAYSGTANVLSSLGGTMTGNSGAALNYYLQSQQQQNLLNAMQTNTANTAAITNYDMIGNPLAGYNASLGAAAGTGQLAAGGAPVDWSSALNSGSDAFAGITPTTF